MRLLIDNLDGRGAVDYTDQVTAEGRMQIVRKLNHPSVFRCELLSGPKKMPGRLGRVVVTRAADGTVLFTGYLTEEPERVYAGEESTGSAFRLRVLAESDDWLLDRQGVTAGGESFGLSGATLLQSLTKRVDPSRFSNQTTGQVLATGMARLRAGKSWSTNAAAIASASYSCYRVVGGAVLLQAIGAISHRLLTTGGDLQPNRLQIRHGRPLVNDATVSGPMEAGSYVTEIFQGDGTTAAFQLSGTPFRGRTGERTTLAEDHFSGATLDPQVWSASDPGAHLSLGSAGLMLSGGNGSDGNTTLQSLGDVELAGGLVAEAGAVALGQGSDGVLLGMYSGNVSRANCVAGFDVRQAGGTTTIGPLVGGAAVGTPFKLVSGHNYVLRLRVWCAAMERVRQTYYTGVDGVVHSFGGGSVPAPLSVVLEVRDLGASSNTPTTVLYDDVVPSSPASVIWAPVNSVQLLGSVGSLRLTATGSAWVRSTVPAGSTATKLMGLAGEGVDGSISADGELRFFSGRVPAAGERVSVLYRTSQRAVARMVNAASIAAEAAGGLPGTAAWTGSVLSPVARSSEDCAASAAAVLAAGSSRTAALQGSYVGEDLPDIWPGDALDLSGVPDAALVIAREVTLRDRAAAPEVIEQEIAFANDWVAPSSLHVSEILATDVAGSPTPVSSVTASVPDLGGLAVTAISATAIQVDAGMSAPTSGGFEVRRRDGGFGPGVDADLVLRSPVRGFSLPRTGMTERFFVRAYDGSTPPQYSWRSSGIVTNVPVS